MDATTVRLIAYTTMLLLAIVTFACSLLGDRRFGRQTLAAGTGPSRQALEFSLVLILMVLLSPQSSKPHFCTMILPSFCLARAALAWPSKPVLVVLLGALALGLAANKDLVGRLVYDWLKWYGGMTIETLLLFVGCCVGLVYRPAASVVTTSTQSSGADNLRRPS
jgi:hypothetical protein